MRTNIEIDDAVLRRAMERFGTRTKRETVDLALRRLVGDSLTVDDALELAGSGWEGDLAEMRGDDR